MGSVWCFSHRKTGWWVWLAYGREIIELPFLSLHIKGVCSQHDLPLWLMLPLIWLRQCLSVSAVMFLLLPSCPLWREVTAQSTLEGWEFCSTCLRVEGLHNLFGMLLPGDLSLLHKWNQLEQIKKINVLNSLINYVSYFLRNTIIKIDMQTWFIYFLTSVHMTFKILPCIFSFFVFVFVFFLLHFFYILCADFWRYTKHWKLCLLQGVQIVGVAKSQKQEVLFQWFFKIRIYSFINGVFPQAFWIIFYLLGKMHSACINILFCSVLVVWWGVPSLDVLVKQVSRALWAAFDRSHALNVDGLFCSGSTNNYQWIVIPGPSFFVYISVHIVTYFGISMWYFGLWPLKTGAWSKVLWFQWLLCYLVSGDFVALLRALWGAILLILCVSAKCMKNELEDKPS